MAVAVWALEASPGGSVCGLCLRLTLTGARQLSWLVQRGVKRPAAAARQRGAEMNETHDPCTSGGTSQDIPGYASSRFLYLLIPRYVSLKNLSRDNPSYASLSILSQVILGYPISENLYWDIPGYPDLPGRSFFQMVYNIARVSAGSELQMTWNPHLEPWYP